MRRVVVGLLALVAGASAAPSDVAATATEGGVLQECVYAVLVMDVNLGYDNATAITKKICIRERALCRDRIDRDCEQAGRQRRAALTLRLHRAPRSGQVGGIAHGRGPHAPRRRH